MLEVGGGGIVDTQRVVEVARLSEQPALTTAAPGLLDDYLRLPDAWAAPVPMELPLAFRRLLEKLPGEAAPPEGDVLVAVEDVPVGAVHVVRHSHEAARLERMNVRASARRRGVGDAMLTAAVPMAAEAGYSQLVLDVMAEREAAIRWYRRRGFGAIPPYQDYRRPMISLARDLNG